MRSAKMNCLTLKTQHICVAFNTKFIFILVFFLTLKCIICIYYTLIFFLPHPARLFAKILTPKFQGKFMSLLISK